MERETGLEPATSSLGSRYAIENKVQMRPRLCILITANHREINACTEKPENGVNGVKSRTSLLTLLRYHSDPPLDRLTALFSAAPKAIHIQIQSPNTNVVHPGGLERIGPLLADLHPDYVISKRRMRKVESIVRGGEKRRHFRRDMAVPMPPGGAAADAGNSMGEDAVKDSIAVSTS